MYYEIDEDGTYVVHFPIWSRIMGQYHIHKTYGIASRSTRLSPIDFDFVVHFERILQPQRWSHDNDRVYQLAEWCNENLNDDWIIHNSHSRFTNESDAMAFKLRWAE